MPCGRPATPTGRSGNRRPKPRSASAGRCSARTTPGFWPRRPRLPCSPGRLSASPCGPEQRAIAAPRLPLPPHRRRVVTTRGATDAACSMGEGRALTLWFIFGLMTAAALFAVLWPLGRYPRAAPGGSDLMVYQDQREEIDRDRAAGMIGEAEAVAPQRRRRAAIAALVILPFGPTGLYMALGSPDVPAQSAFARVKKSQGQE